jgi:hypothetical protein
VNSDGHTDWTTLKLALIAGVLTMLSLSVNGYTYSLFMENVALGQTLVAVTAATTVLLLLSIMYAIFDRVDRARTVLVIGIAALMISAGINALQMSYRLANGWP